MEHGLLKESGCAVSMAALVCSSAACAAHGADEVVVCMAAGWSRLRSSCSSSSCSGSSCSSIGCRNLRPCGGTGTVCSDNWLHHNWL